MAYHWDAHTCSLMRPGMCFHCLAFPLVGLWKCSVSRMSSRSQGSMLPVSTPLCGYLPCSYELQNGTVLWPSDVWLGHHVKRFWAACFLLSTQSCSQSVERCLLHEWTQSGNSITDITRDLSFRWLCRIQEDLLAKWLSQQEGFCHSLD